MADLNPKTKQPGSPAAAERRESPRVPVEIELNYEVIPSSRVKETVSAVMARVNSLDEEAPESNRIVLAAEDPVAAMREDMINLQVMMAALLAKVDLIQKQVSGEGPEPVSRRVKKPLSILNCSGTGVGLLTSESHAEGEYLRIHIELPLTPRVAIDCVGLIVRNVTLEEFDGGDRGSIRGAQAARYDLGVHFSDIHEADRERLIQYLFKVQRRLLRDRREARDAMAI